MKLKPPLPIGTITQRFGENATPTYAASGLVGHTGIDFGVPYGTPIQAAVDAFCYALMNKDNPNLMAYRGVYTIVDDGDVSYEVTYGHCSTIGAVAGSVYAVGDQLARVGNTGNVWVGQHQVTAAEKNSGSTAGSHLHFQVRKVKKVLASTNPSGALLTDANGIFVKDGYCYQIPDYHDGYMGCVDPFPFFGIPFIFTKNLWWGMRNNDVLELQKRLGVMQTGFFGSLTYAAVRAYQSTKGISTTGFVGVLTRAALNGSV